MVFKFSVLGVYLVSPSSVKSPTNLALSGLSWGMNLWRKKFFNKIYIDFNLLARNPVYLFRLAYRLHKFLRIKIIKPFDFLIRSIK